MIWDFAGEPIPPGVCADLHRFAEAIEGEGAVGARLSELLDRFEVDAMGARVRHLLATGAFPDPGEDYHAFPWPLI